MCWPHKTDTEKPKRRIAVVRTPLVAPVAPVMPEDIRVTPDGLLAVRGLSGDPDHPWLILDRDNPLLIVAADDAAADGWPTLRSRWHTVNLISGQDLADKHDVDRATVSKWRLDPEFPPVSATIGDRQGHYPEMWPLLDLWHANRKLRTGRPPNET